ncbi:MAG: LysE family translocator [Bacteroidales bacterium]|nr:LysE family translocator [Bacteroidales bacterium]
MELQLILSFFGASILLSLMPGPDNIFVLTESLTKGYKNGIAISLGLVFGIMIHTLAATTGISIIIQKSAMAFSIIKYFGAAYLFYLAIKAIKEKRPEISFEDSKAENKVNMGKLIRKGFLMNVLNPKVSLFFIAFLPQFITPDGYNVSLQMILLGILFMLQALLVFGGIAILSGKLTPYLNSSRFWKITKWSKVGVLAILGITLAFAKK